MSTVALLRGINVGGAGKLPMVTLRAALIAAGALDPETYIQSGNAVFEGEVDADDARDQIERRAGFRPQLLLIDGAKFADMVRANPFADAVDDPKALHLFFLSRPSATSERTLNDATSADEDLCLTPHVMYLHTPKYLSGSKVAPKAEKLLGVSVTARNWNTVIRLANMLESRS